jgi:hypothetical protein
MGKKFRTDGSRLRLESKLLNDTRLLHSHGTSRLFRNTVGAAYVGEAFHMADGSVVIPRPTRITYGLGPGTSDLIGWKSRIIQPGDVGFRMAQFVALEGKSPAGRCTEGQRDFLRLAWDSGALAGVVRDLNDVQLVLAGGPFNADDE